MHPGERIKEIRKANKMSQKKFSGRLGYSYGYLAEIELGKKQPSRNFLKKLGEEFGVSIDYVLFGSIVDRAGAFLDYWKERMEALKELAVIPKASISDDEMAILQLLRSIPQKNSLGVIKELLESAEGFLFLRQTKHKYFTRLKMIVEKEEWAPGIDLERMLESLDIWVKKHRKKPPEFGLESSLPDDKKN